MYQRSLDGKLYHYGDVETSDHFMVQGCYISAMHKYYFSYYWYLNLTLSQGMETDLGYNNLCLNHRLSRLKLKDK
jgi:hypothetical protein